MGLGLAGLLRLVLRTSAPTYINRGKTVMHIEVSFNTKDEKAKVTKTLNKIIYAMRDVPTNSNLCFSYDETKMLVEDLEKALLCVGGTHAT